MEKVDIRLIVFASEKITKEAKCWPHCFTVHRKFAAFNIRDSNIAKENWFGLWSAKHFNVRDEVLWKFERNAFAFAIRIHRLYCQACHRRSVSAGILIEPSASWRLFVTCKAELWFTSETERAFPRWMDYRSNCARRREKSLAWLDMSNASICWMGAHFPKVRIVFDDFHVIRQMNERQGYIPETICQSRELIAMAKTIREKFLGIIAYWDTFDRRSNVLTEGFNNRISTAHSPGIWLSRRILSQIEDFSVFLNSTSEGALIYGSNRRRGDNFYKCQKVYFFLQNGATAQNTPTQSSTAAGVV